MRVFTSLLGCVSFSIIESYNVIDCINKHKQGKVILASSSSFFFLMHFCMHLL